MRNVLLAGLIVGTMLVLFALVALLGAVQASGGLQPRPIVHTRDHVVEPPTTAAAAADAAKALEPAHPTLTPDPVEDRTPGEAAPTGTPRPWSPKSIALSPIADEVSVRAVRLETYDPAMPGPPPSPFASPKIRLAAEDTRAGLDR